MILAYSLFTQTYVNFSCRKSNWSNDVAPVFIQSFTKNDEQYFDGCDKNVDVSEV